MTCDVFCRGADLANHTVASAAKVCADAAAGALSVEATAARSSVPAFLPTPLNPAPQPAFPFSFLGCP